MRNLHMLRSSRTNAAGGQFESLMLVDLDYLRDYSNSCKDAKSVRGAVTKLNKAASDRYACCYRSYRHYELIGKIKTDKEAGFDITEYSMDALREQAKIQLGVKL